MEVTPGFFYHRTTREAADAILANGFRDGTGTYLTEKEHAGVWLSEVPLDANEGAYGDALLLIVMPLSKSEQDQYEWVEEEKPYHEWMFPAALINERASSIRDVTAWHDDDTLEERVAHLKAGAPWSAP